MDEPSQPIYCNPVDFKNLYDNDYITYVNDDDVVNNLYNDTTYNNFVNYYYNIYNNDSDTQSGGTTTVNSTYDDSNLISKLSVWFGDVNKNLKKIVDRLDKVIDIVSKFSSEPNYVYFSDCITKNVPIANDIKVALNYISFNNASKALVFEHTFSAFGIEDYTIVIDLSWYEAYRLRIRSLLSISCYICAIGSIWHAIQSVFGIHISARSLE